MASAACSAMHQPWGEILAALDPRGVHGWADSAAVARAVLGGAADGTVRALAAYETRLAVLDADLEAAEALFRSTRPILEIGAAAMRCTWRLAYKRVALSANS